MQVRMEKQAPETESRLQRLAIVQQQKLLRRKRQPQPVKKWAFIFGMLIHFYIHNIKSIREIRLKSFFSLKFTSFFPTQRSTQTVGTEEKLDRIYSRELYYQYTINTDFKNNIRKDIFVQHENARNNSGAFRNAIVNRTLKRLPSKTTQKEPNYEERTSKDGKRTRYFTRLKFERETQLIAFDILSVNAQVALDMLGIRKKIRIYKVINRPIVYKHFKNFSSNIRRPVEWSFKHKDLR